MRHYRQCYTKNMSSNSDIDDYLDHIFDSIDPNIRLDDEQKAAVLGEDDNALVVAGAGTGKTTTIAAKVKYLTEIKNIPPEKILVLSYTKKAVEELRRRINIDLDVPARVTTFHSLGLKYARLLNDHIKVCPIDSNERARYFLKFFKNKVFSTKETREEFVSLFNDDQISWIDPRSRAYGRFFKEHYKDFDSFEDYFEAYIEQKIRETKDITKRVNDIADQKLNGDHPVTIRGEIMKSKGEAVIANYLLCNGIDYEYERVYEELVGERQIYRPDFSIDVGGEKIYIEYFGMSGSDYDNRSYQKIRRQKEDYHRQKHNKFIALDYQPNRHYLRKLAEELRKLDVTPKPKPIEEIYRIELKQNPLAELFNLEKFFFDIIDAIKTSDRVKSFDEYKSFCNQLIDSEKNEETKRIKQRQLCWIECFWDFYNEQKTKDSTMLKVDYSDMIRIPCGELKKIIPDKIDFDYVIVDEYQDISAARYRLLKETVDTSKAKFFAIGDDWQSIFSFQGAKVSYIIDFEKYFPGARKYIISKTYRNAQSLIDTAGTFVMRNARQIKKSLRSNKDLDKPICFVKIKPPLKRTASIADRNNAVEIMLRQIHHEHPKASVCVLGRTNRSIDTLFENPNFINSAETKAHIKGIDGYYFDAMTIHKSKGLTFDWTIIMPLTSFFPSDPKKIFWALDIVRNEPEPESIPYAEQRRLLYVALTRTRNRVFILMPNKGDHSRYKDELNEIIRQLETLQNKRLD